MLDCFILQRKTVSKKIIFLWFQETQVRDLDQHRSRCQAGMEELQQVRRSAGGIGGWSGWHQVRLFWVCRTRIYIFICWYNTNIIAVFWCMGVKSIFRLVFSHEKYTLSMKDAKINNSVIILKSKLQVSLYCVLVLNLDF